MTSLFLFSLSLLAAQPEPASEEDRTMVVTGARIRDLRAALEACIRRNCPPDEDVNATLALAEGEFLNGDYIQAEQSIRESISRNQRHAGQFPEPVADLWRSQARVQAHRGRDPQALRSTRNILNTLQEGLPREDHRHFTARLEIIEALIKSRDYRGSRDALEALIGAARASDREDIARLAEMRMLRLDYAAGTGRRAPALRRLEQLAASADPSLMFETVSSRMFLAQVYRQAGDETRADAMLANVPRSQSENRVLLSAPPIALPERASAQRGDFVDVSSTPESNHNYDRTWIDVGYWIEPEGRVSGVEILRQGSGSSWAAPLLNSIRGRIYSPSQDNGPSYRLERYTFTAPFERTTGSRVARRTQPRIEFMDLTNPDEPGRAVPTGVQSSERLPG